MWEFLHGKVVSGVSRITRQILHDTVVFLLDVFGVIVSLSNFDTDQDDYN